MFDLSQEQKQKILELIRERRMIEAIKNYRLFTGAGLGEAKDVVTKMFHEDLSGLPPSIPPDD